MGCFQSTTLLLAFICGGLPPSGDVAVRVREIMRACILASSQEYQLKPYGEVLGFILRMWGAVCKQPLDEIACYLGTVLAGQGMERTSSHQSPCFGNSYTCKDTQDVLSSVGVAIREMNEIQRSTLTHHFHLSMQGTVMDNITCRSAMWAPVRMSVQKLNES